MSSRSVIIEVEGPVGLLTSNRGDRPNAFDETLIEEITSGLDELEANDAVRIIVLSAAGKSFCAGTDLHGMERAAGHSPEENVASAKKLAELMRTLNELRKPTVARVQGPAYGVGVGLVADRPITGVLIDGTARSITRQRASAEGPEGIDAVLAKPNPNWIQVRTAGSARS